jgi:hypothetical protein
VLPNAGPFFDKSFLTDRICAILRVSPKGSPCAPELHLRPSDP